MVLFKIDWFKNKNINALNENGANFISKMDHVDGKSRGYQAKNALL